MLHTPSRSAQADPHPGARWFFNFYRMPRTQRLLQITGLLIVLSAPAALAQTSLTEAGNDAFGTIQEVVVQLEADPDTDWSAVNLEGLRQHLVDMREMTLNVEIVAASTIPGGSEIVLRATTERAVSALNRVFSAHPSQLHMETGWTMNVSETNGQYILTTTTEEPSDVEKLRGLGYIGLMALGNHHQEHHWAMATGLNPHADGDHSGHH